MQSTIVEKVTNTVKQAETFADSSRNVTNLWLEIWDVKNTYGDYNVF